MVDHHFPETTRPELGETSSFGHTAKDGTRKKEAGFLK
jgi:hypothetical protein